MGSFSLRWRILIETVALIATVASGTLLFGAKGTIAAGILATIIVLFRSLGLTRQFSDLTEDVVRMTSIDRTHRLNPAGPAELARLARAVNRLVDRVGADISKEESERLRLSSIFNSMRDGVVVVDDQGVIELANPAAVEMLATAIPVEPGMQLTSLTNHPDVVGVVALAISSGNTESAEVELFDNQRTLMALATPFAIQISDDDTTIVASAASSDTIFTLDAATGEILGRVQVDAVPRGIALQSDSNGKASQAWVLNAVANTVSLIDVSNAAKLKVIETITLQDSTDSEVKRGRIAFNTAAASTTGTYSCASCHPDGHTDQLLWVLNTPIVTGGNQIMPRSTMPISGLRDTEPYHWDGIPGDPYGGINSANIRKHVEPNSDVKDPVTSARHLIDGGLANTMMTVGDKKVNDKGQAGELSDAERDAMAKFLLSVTYPPA